MSRRFSLNTHLPFKSKFATIAGYSMHYIDECAVEGSADPASVHLNGSGAPPAGRAERPVVVLLHGNPTWSFLFRSLILKLRNHFRVIAPDHIGCGLSDHPPDAHFRALDRSLHVKELLDQLGIRNFSMVMHDWGGPIGAGMAVRIPDRVERLVFLNTTLTETESLPGIIKRAAHPLIGKFITQHTKRFLKLLLSFGSTRTLPPEVKEGYLYPYRTRADRTAIWDFVDDIPFDGDHPSYHDMLEMATKLPLLRHVPVQIVWGLRDPCFHREMLMKVARHFPQAEIVELPQASHLVFEDEPEVAPQKIFDFLTAPRVSPDRPIRAHAQSDGSTERGADSSHGGLYAAFAAQAAARPDSEAVIEPSFGGVNLGFNTPVRYRPISYRELHSLVRQYERGLTELGLKARERVVMLVPPSIEFVALSYALMGRGAVPVFMDPGIGLENLLRCLADVDARGFIGSPKAHLLRLFNRKLFKRFAFRVVVSEIPLPGTTSLGYLKRFAALPLPTLDMLPQDPALVAFTSGATGTPKGVIFTQSMLHDQLRIFSESFGMRPGGKDLPLLPIFALFSAGLGVCSVIPPINPAKPLDLDPGRVTKLINDLKIDSSFGSPTLWNKIAEYAVRAMVKLPTLRRIYMAGAPVPIPVVERLRQVVGHNNLFTPYGATEALPVSVISASELLDAQVPKARQGEEGTPVGSVVAGVELRILAGCEGPIEFMQAAKELPPFEIGEVVVRGKNVSSAYLHRPDANRMGKIIDGETVWHRMGDMAYRDEGGKVYFCGRKAHLVRGLDRVYYTDPVERIFNRHPQVRRSALIGVGIKQEVSISGEQKFEPAIVIEPFPNKWPSSEEAKGEFAREVLEVGSKDGVTQAIRKVYFCHSFPVDARHNAKIFRDRLAVWAREERCYPGSSSFDLPGDLPSAPTPDPSSLQKSPQTVGDLGNRPRAL